MVTSRSRLIFPSISRASHNITSVWLAGSTRPARRAGSSRVARQCGTFAPEDMFDTECILLPAIEHSVSLCPLFCSLSSCVGGPWKIRPPWTSRGERRKGMPCRHRPLTARRTSARPHHTPAAGARLNGRAPSRAPAAPGERAPIRELYQRGQPVSTQR